MILLICLLVIAIVMVAIAAVSYKILTDRLIGSPDIWCFNDWMCKAPSSAADLETFNGKFPGVCGSTDCIAGEEYNAIEERIIPSISDCFPTGPTPTVYVDKVTGCQVPFGPGAVKVPQNCGKFRYKTGLTWNTGHVYDCSLITTPPGVQATSRQVMDRYVFGQS